jgi:hypothetical protein
VPADAPTVVSAPPDVTPVAPSGARAMDLDFGK